MPQRLLPRLPRDLTRTGLISGRLLVALALLLGTMTVGIRTASAQSAGSFDYDEDGVSWSVEYDDDVWTDADSDAADFALETGDGNLAQFLTIPDVGVDPATCLENVIPEFEGENGAGATDAVAYEDVSGDPIAGETDAYAYEVRTITLGGEDAETVHACWAIDGESVLWAVTLVPGGDEDELEAAYALVDGVAIDGEPTPIGLPAGDGGPTGGTSDDETTPDASDDAAAEASDDATPGADDGTPGAGDSGADEDAGTYSSPTYGYGLAWPTDDFTVEVDEEASPQNARDVLQLVDVEGASLLYVEGADAEWTDTDDCVSTLLEEIGLDIDGSEAILDLETDEPYAISEDSRSAEAYTGTLETPDGDLDASVLVDCRADDSGELIVGFTNVSLEVDDYFGVAYPAVEEILDSLEF